MYQRIYQLALKRDEEELNKLIRSSKTIHVYQNGITPIKQLAKEGQHQAVAFLIKKFDASLNQVVEGYVEGGYLEQVHFFVTAYPHLIPDAVYVFAQQDNLDQVEYLIEQGAPTNLAVCGYASRGLVERVNDLLNRNASIDHAVWSYARFGYVQAAEDLLLRGADMSEAFNGFARDGWLEDDNHLLHLFSLIHHAEIKKNMAEYIRPIKKEWDLGIIYKKSNKINSLINEYQFEYDLAKNWLLPNLHFWFLQGIQLIQTHCIPLEIFIHISSYIFGLTSKQTTDIYEKHWEIMPKKLLGLSKHGLFTQNNFQVPADCPSLQLDPDSGLRIS